MTGMGKDGAQKIGDIYRAGGLTLGQDEGSSIVYGMPRVAFENGFVQKQIALQDIGPTLCRLAKEANG
jgi:two-component system chemotaxis response regulator CheB